MATGIDDLQREIAERMEALYPAAREYHALRIVLDALEASVQSVRTNGVAAASVGAPPAGKSRASGRRGDQQQRLAAKAQRKRDARAANRPPRP